MSNGLPYSQQDSKKTQILSNIGNKRYQFNESERGDRNNMRSCNKNFYWSLDEASNYKFHNLTLGYRIFEVSKIQQSLVTSCLKCLQSNAKFPIIIYSKNVQNKKTQKRDKSSRFLTDFWMQTKIFRPNRSVSQSEEEINRKYEYQIYKFFSIYLVPKLQKFKSQYLDQSVMNVQHLQHKNSSENQIIENFKIQILNQINQKFSSFINTNECSS